MWWKGQQGRILFESLRTGDACTSLSSLSMRTRHPHDGTEVWFVLWVLHHEAEYIQREAG